MSRSEEKNKAARDALEPLAEGQRPLIVTIGAALSTLVFASIVIAWLAGVEVDGSRPPFLQVLGPSVLTGVMAYGMWRARYWAVLGFQTVLMLLILATAMGLVVANSATQVIGNLVVILVAGTLFWFMVKGMARIQMPVRRPPDEPDEPQD
jgi:hypothetical protein